MYRVQGYWGGNKVIVSTHQTLDEAITSWLAHPATSIYCGRRLIRLLRTGPTTYRWSN